METDVEEVVAELVEEAPAPKLTRAGRRHLAAHDRIRHVEDELLEKAQNVIEDVLDFAEIDPASEDGNEELIQRWSKELGSRAAALKRYRIALAGWASSAQAPAGIKIAQETYIGITKARAKEVTVNIGTLNAVVMMPQCATADDLLKD